MSAPTLPLVISEESQERVVHYLSSALNAYNTTYNIRSQMEVRDKAYYRENDNSLTQRKAQAANQSGDPTKIQNITVPVVMPHVETALAYLQEVFLSGYPIFGTVAPPEQQDAMTMMDTIIGENSTRCGWPLELLQTMRDGLKYDVGAVEVVWENRKLFSVTTPQQNNLQEGTPTETYYAGNYLKRLNMYNVVLDTRVSPEKNHTDGEYASYTEILSRIATKKRMEDLPALGTMNFRKALESAGPANANDTDRTAATFMPSINPGALLPTGDRQAHDWMQWAGLAATEGTGIAYKNAYEWTVLYARILPSDFAIRGKNRNHVQIWKFIIINRQVVIFAERQTNAHNYLPIVVCKPSADGMEWQSKSFAENVTPTQEVASSLMNSALESQRRKVYDRMFYDPSRINKKDIDQVSSVARIPVKNSAYGKTLAEAIYQVPYRDDGVAEIVNLSQTIAQMGDITNGQNRVSQGQFQKGNKTRSEFETVMSNAGSRNRMMALGLEYSFFVPIKEIIKSNVLQYQPAINLTNSDTKEQVPIDPEVLRKANMSFALSDGYLPSDKMMSGETMGMLFQGAQALPMLGVEYDLMGMFVYSMKLKGANWLNSFKRNDEQKAQYMQQMGLASQAAGPGAAPAAKPSGEQ